MSSFEILNEADVAVEMEAALKEYDQVGAELGIIPSSCKFFADDPSWLTR
ncbi:phosphoinositide phosphatase SAC1-like, partial [Trifolium medium]|nr:phosphoinositide phosphatase SAC1-like [Trifolium medium]